MGENTPDYISSDCQLAGHHIEQGMQEAAAAASDAPAAKQPEMAHPITLMRRAYGL
jgi:hypothetical protein